MPIYLNREEEIKGKAPLEFYGNGQNLKDWEIKGKTSENLVESVTVSNNQALYGVPLFLEADLKPDTEYTFAFQLTEGYYIYWNEFLFTNNTPFITGAGDTTIVVTKRTRSDLSKNDLRQYNAEKGGWVIHKNRKEEDFPASYTNIRLYEGSYTADTLPPYEPYGGVGDWDETEQKYRIPVRVEGENLFDINGDYSAYMHQGSPTCRVDNGQIIVNVVPYYFAHIKFSALIPSGQYTIKCKASANFRAMRLLLTKPFDTGTWNESYQRYYADMVKNDNYYTYTFNVDEDFSIGFAISGTTGDTGVIEEIMLNEGTTAFPYEGITTNLYTDHQLMDGDSISLSSTQINIPTLNTHNILTVPTQVQPSNITLTLPQTETEITKILGPLINPRYDITDAYFGNLQVFTVWDTYTGQLPTTLYTTDWGLVDYKIYGTADGAGIKTKNLYNYNAPDAVSLNLYPSEENGKLLSGQNNVSIIFTVKPDTIYSIYKLSTTRFRWACYAAAPQEGDEATSFSSSVSNTNKMITFVTDSNAAYAVVFIRASNDSIDRDVLLKSVVVVEGPYAAQDAPYGYKIPMRSQDSVVDIYIGDTPLGENEYVSYNDQKIYKYINGVLTPTDPPKELPMITTINGNTTIDTTLEEKQYITSDNKVYCVKNGGRYLLKGSGLRPDNFYSKYRKGGT